jgi:hypothetical protein
MGPTEREATMNYELYKTKDLESGDLTLCVPLEVRVYEDGRAVASYEGAPDEVYPSLAALESAHRLDLTDEEPLTHRIEVDWQYNAEGFWEALTERTDTDDYPEELAAPLIPLIARGLAYTTRDLADKLMAFLATVPGFNDGPAHAPTAVRCYELEGSPR